MTINTTEQFFSERLVHEEVPASNAGMSVDGLLLPISVRRLIGETSRRDYGTWVSFEVAGVGITADMSKPNLRSHQNSLRVAVDGQYTSAPERESAEVFGEFVDLLINASIRYDIDSGIDQLGDDSNSMVREVFETLLKVGEQN